MGKLPLAGTAWGGCPALSPAPPPQCRRHKWRPQTPHLCRLPAEADSRWLGAFASGRVVHDGIRIAVKPGASFPVLIGHFPKLWLAYLQWPSSFFLDSNRKRPQPGPFGSAMVFLFGVFRFSCLTGYGRAHWPLGSFAPALGGFDRPPTLLSKIQAYCSMDRRRCTLALLSILIFFLHLLQQQFCHRGKHLILFPDKI